MADKMHYRAAFISIGLFILVSANLGNEIEILSLVCSGFFVVFTINFGRVLEKTIVSKLLCSISYASMCAYLFHRPFYYYLMQWKGYFPIWEAYVLFLPALLVLCHGIQRLYDRLVRQITDMK